jgi:hypothetical protein
MSSGSNIPREGPTRAGHSRGLRALWISLLAGLMASYVLSQTGTVVPPAGRFGGSHTTRHLVDLDAK